MRKLIITLVVLAGCGGAPQTVVGNWTCSAPSRCAADPARSAEVIAACNHILAAQCGEQFKYYVSCVYDHTTCTDTDTTDTSTSGLSAVHENCDVWLQNFNDCCSTVSAQTTGACGGR